MLLPVVTTERKLTGLSIKEHFKLELDIADEFKNKITHRSLCFAAVVIIFPKQIDLANIIPITIKVISVIAK